MYSWFEEVPTENGLYWVINKDKQNISPIITDLDSIKLFHESGDMFSGPIEVPELPECVKPIEYGKLKIGCFDILYVEVPKDLLVFENKVIPIIQQNINYLTIYSDGNNITITDTGDYKNPFINHLIPITILNSNFKNIANNYLLFMDDPVLCSICSKKNFILLKSKIDSKENNNE